MFNASRSFARRSLTVAVLLAIIIASAAGALINARSTDQAIRRQLESRSRTVALLLDQTDVQQLTGRPSDLDMPYYQRLKAKLAELKAANPDIRSLYYTVNADDKLYFYVDSEPPGSPAYSEPGEYYPEATDAFKAIFRTGQAINEGPAQDEYGTWVSGLAPVRSQSNGAILGVLGLDIDAGYYYRSVALAAVVPVLLGLILLGIVLVYEWQRLREARTLRLQSELVSIASHELRSPLAGIRWSAESLVRRLNGANKTAVQRIHASVSNLQAAVDDIMQLTRENSGKNRTLEPVDCELTEVLKDICDTQLLSAEQRGISLKLDESFRSPLTVRCDIARLRRALHNVISNAIKYTRDNTTVTISYAATTEYHQIIVADQGIGIPVDEQAQVFGGFYRASNAKASGIEGTGLGLYLTKSIIEQHGGTVSFSSRQDEGTVFTLALPR